MIIDDIKKAIETNAAIKIEYVNDAGDESERVLTGVKYSQAWGATHIDAFDSKSQGLRNFKIDRIQKLSFVEDVVGIPQKTSESIPNPSSESKPKVKEVYQFNPDKPIFQLYGVEY